MLPCRRICSEIICCRASSDFWFRPYILEKFLATALGESPLLIFSLTFLYVMKLKSLLSLLHQYFHVQQHLVCFLRLVGFVNLLLVAELEWSLIGRSFASVIWVSLRSSHPRLLRMHCLLFNLFLLPLLFLVSHPDSIDVVLVAHRSSLGVVLTLHSLLPL